MNLLWPEQRNGILDTKGVRVWEENLGCFLLLLLHLQLGFVYGCQTQSATTFVLFRSSCTGP